MNNFDQDPDSLSKSLDFIQKVAKFIYFPAFVILMGFVIFATFDFGLDFKSATKDIITVRKDLDKELVGTQLKAFDFEKNATKLLDSTREEANRSLNNIKDIEISLKKKHSEASNYFQTAQEELDKAINKYSYSIKLADSVTKELKKLEYRITELNVSMKNISKTIEDNKKKIDDYEKYFDKFDPQIDNSDKFVLEKLKTLKTIMFEHEQRIKSIEKSINKIP